MATTLKSSQREFKENPNKINRLTLFAPKNFLYSVVDCSVAAQNIKGERIIRVF
jgi:hypothetical protein